MLSEQSKIMKKVVAGKSNTKVKVYNRTPFQSWFQPLDGWRARKKSGLMFTIENFFSGGYESSASLQTHFLFTSSVIRKWMVIAGWQGFSPPVLFDRLIILKIVQPLHYCDGTVWNNFSYYCCLSLPSFHGILIQNHHLGAFCSAGALMRMANIVYLKPRSQFESKYIYITAPRKTETTTRSSFVRSNSKLNHNYSQSLTLSHHHGSQKSGIKGVIGKLLTIYFHSILTLLKGLTYILMCWSGICLCCFIISNCCYVSC